MTSVNWRVPFGFLLAPVLPCAGLDLALERHAMLLGTGVMVIVSWAVIVVFAVPVYLILGRCKRIGLVDCIAGGAASALAPNLAMRALSWFVLPSTGYSSGDSGGAITVDGRLTTHGAWVDLRASLFSMALGACIGLCFWFIALRTGSRDGKRISRVQTPEIRTTSQIGRPR
jgi:hypothetical protein